MKISDLEILDLLLRLPDGAALTTAEAAVFLRVSPRTLERWRAPGATTKGPAYIQGGDDGAEGSNQKVTYLKRDLIAWQDAHRVSSSVEAAVRKGQLSFATLADLAEERPYWRTPKGLIGGLVEDTSVDLFFARLGKWKIEWLPADEAASDTWESLLSQRAFAGTVSDTLRNCLGHIEAGMERSEMEHALGEAPGGDGPKRLQDF